MPTYEYECTKCGSVIEVFQGITEKPLRKADCEVCGERTPVRRLIGAGAGIVFKGTGFYATDYRSDAYKKAAKADRPDTEGKSDTGESSKPSASKSEKSKAAKAAAE